MCTCSHCDTEFHVWNKNNQLMLYVKDPVFNKDQIGYSITPKPGSEAPSLVNISNSTHFEWLIFYINHLDIQSLQPIIGYLFGEAKCPECKTNFDIFKAVSDPLSYGH